MRVLHRYLLREMGQTFAACFVVLLLVSATGVLVDLLGRIARGNVPASLLLSQFGLRTVDALPMLIPLALFLGLLLSISRLYRDNEMAVLRAAGMGLSGLLRPALWLIGSLTALVAAISMWLAPEAGSLSKQMIDTANRSLLVAGLEPGRFVELPGRHSVVYIGAMNDDGSRFSHLFVHSDREERVDVVTAERGELYTEAAGEERYLRLDNGFRVEGVPGRNDFKVMRFARNDIRVPDIEPTEGSRSERRLSTQTLLADDGPGSHAELHWRMAAPIACLLLGLLAVPLARSPPRAARYGGLLVALAVYLIYLNTLIIGRAQLADGALPVEAGLWWMHAPVLVLAAVLLRRGERMPRTRGQRRGASAR